MSQVNSRDLVKLIRKRMIEENRKHALAQQETSNGNAQPGSATNSRPKNKK